MSTHHKQNVHEGVPDVPFSCTCARFGSTGLMPWNGNEVRRLFCSLGDSGVGDFEFFNTMGDLSFFLIQWAILIF